MKQTIVFEAEPIGTLYRGLAIDMRTFEPVQRTRLYACAEDAKAAAVSQWRASQNPIASQAIKREAA